jgi:hypothetical protein
MWILYGRTPKADVACFPGRRWLALLDAVAWPVAWLIAISAIPYVTGVLEVFAKAVLVLIALRRCQRALFRNERYRFSSLRWGVPILTLVALGELMKVLA